MDRARAEARGPLTDRPIAELLDELGYSGDEAQRLARVALEGARLTNPSKQRMSDAKLPRARVALAARFVRSCDDPQCERALRSSRVDAELVSVARRTDCEHCRGSDNRRAALRFLTACRKARVVRVVIVGGSPSVRVELGALIGNDIALRLIDGTARRRQDQAQADLAWADLVLVWGSSQLDHTVSSHYTDSGAARRKIVAVGQRGIVALLGEGAIHLEAR